MFKLTGTERVKQNARLSSHIGKVRNSHQANKCLELNWLFSSSQSFLTHVKLQQLRHNKWLDGL